MTDLLRRLRDDQALAEQFADEIGSRVNANYDLLASEADELVELFFSLAETPDGANLLALLLGVANLEDVFEEFESRLEDEEEDE